MARKRKSKRLNQLTQVFRDENDRTEGGSSSDEGTEKFRPSQGKISIVEEECDAPLCHRKATRTIVTEDDDGESENTYNACERHAGRKSFNGQKVLKEYEGIPNDTDEEEGQANTGTIVNKPTETTGECIPVVEVPTLESMSFACEIENCPKQANYESNIDTGKGLKVIRTCADHANEQAVGKGPFEDITLINSDGMSEYSLSSLHTSDLDADKRVKKAIREILPAITPAVKGQRKSRTRSLSSPYALTTPDKQKDTPSSRVRKSDVASKEILGSADSVTVKDMGDVELSENMINNATQPDQEVAQKSLADANPDITMIDSTDEEDGYFPSVMIPKGENLSEFPNNPNSSNAVHLYIDDARFGLALDWKVRDVIKSLAKQANIPAGDIYLYNQEHILKFSATIRELVTEGTIRNGTRLQIQIRPSRSSPQPMDYDTPNRDINASRHNPANAKQIGSDEVNPNKENPIKSMMEKAKTQAFLGKKTTFADVAGNKKVEVSTSSWINKLRCAISPEMKTRRPVPNTDQAFVAFWDLSTVVVSQIDLWEAIQEANPRGMTYRENAQWLELGFDTVEQRDKHLATQILLPNEQRITPLPPRKYSPQQVYIRLGNVPIRPEEEIRKALKEYWSNFGIVGRIEPNYYRDSKILSRRWDMILTIQPGKSLGAPVIFNLFSTRVCCNWEGSKPACTNCKTEGHWSQNCSPALRREAEKRDRLAPAPPIPRKA